MLIPQGNIRKARKCLPSGIVPSSCELSFGLFGLRVLEPCRVTAKQLEACRKILARSTKKNGRVWMKAFPHYPITKKPADVRMGNGKGGIEFYVAALRAGSILFEVDGIAEEEAKVLFQRTAYKLGVPTKFIARRFTKLIASTN